MFPLLLDVSILFKSLHTETKAESFSWTSVLNQYAFYRNRAMQRRQLLSLSDEQLKDIGITRFDANAEANKAFWEN